MELLSWIRDVWEDTIATVIIFIIVVILVPSVLVIIPVLLVISILLIITVLVVIVVTVAGGLRARRLSITDKVTDASFVVVSCVDGIGSLPFDWTALVRTGPIFVEIGNCITEAAVWEGI